MESARGDRAGGHASGGKPVKIEAHSRLRMARGVRLFWDEVRQQHYLLFPEGMLVLNTTAFRVLKLCNGQRTVGEMVKILADQHASAKVEKGVYHLLSRIVERGLLETSNE